ncbi:cupin domain-containing protein [Sphingomonas sp.]|uniref:cupin domain-containing protein n=1 Tax=Sphingomonas sp. TaxID=28214 RepID=UPI00333F9A37
MPHPLIASLNLSPHPEGGWYRETMRQPAPDPASGRKPDTQEPRGLATAILFLLEDGRRSHWHRVDAAELWLWHAGSPLTVRIGQEEHLLSGETPQALVPPGAWQSAEARLGWALVSCVVTPAFDFGGFELAPPGWSPA